MRSTTATWRSRRRNCPPRAPAVPRRPCSDLLHERQRKQELRDRHIVVDVHITSHAARFVVRDDGQGFDREKVCPRRQELLRRWLEPRHTAHVHADGRGDLQPDR